MRVFTKDWRITGTIKIEAETVEEAELKFLRLTQHDLADDGELETDSAAEEIAK